MSALTPTAGYPVHAVARICRWENGLQSRFTDWRAQCGVTGTETTWATLGTAGSARRLELCAACFPGRDHNACKPDAPVQIQHRDDL